MGIIHWFEQGYDSKTSNNNIGSSKELMLINDGMMISWLAINLWLFCLIHNTVIYNTMAKASKKKVIAKQTRGEKKKLPRGYK